MEVSPVAKLKIAFFIDTHTPGAGTETQLIGILRHLDPERVTARLFTLRGEFPAGEREQLRWPVECLQVRRLFSLDGLRKFCRLVGRLRRERYDVVMIYFLDTNLFVTPACYLAGIRGSVVNRRDMGYWYEPGILRKLNAVNRLTGHFLVNSRAIKERVVACERIPPDRVEVIGNGLWPRPPAGGRAPSRRDLDLQDDAQVVGIVANLRPVKRIDRFLEMAALVAAGRPDCRFLILGRGELEGQLRAQAVRLGIAERVSFLGQVQDVPGYLALFDVGVLTSESEGLSNCLMEYAQAGLPAVAFDTGGNREIVRDGQNGFLVPEGDTAALARRVEEILADPDRGHALGETGRRICAEQFAPDRIMSQTMEFFERVAAGGRDRRRDRS